MLWSAIDTIVTDLTDANTTDFPTATRLIYANEAQSSIAGMIIQADGNWQWDDTNYSDLPIGKADLVAAQQDYSFDDAMLQIEGVSVLDTNGNYRKLVPIEKRDIGRGRATRGHGYRGGRTVGGYNNYPIDPEEYMKTDGLPVEYDKQGRSVFLYPAPAAADVTTSNGLKVYFKRTTKNITSFGSTSAGFASPFHIILAYMIALPYCAKYKKDRVPLYEKKIDDLKRDIMKHYSHRRQDEKDVMTPRKTNFL